MARNATVDIPADTWTQLTANDVTNITFQVTGGSEVWVKATTDTTTPTSQDDVLVYAYGNGETNVAMSALFAGLALADRVWAYSPHHPAAVFVSHA